MLRVIIGGEIAPDDDHGAPSRIIRYWCGLGWRNSGSRWNELDLWSGRIPLVLTPIMRLRYLVVG